MTRKDYKRMTLADMQKKRWRLRRDVETGMMKIPAGTIVEILDKRSGLKIRADACKHCGVSIHASRVGPDALEEIA